MPGHNLTCLCSQFVFYETAGPVPLPGAHAVHGQREVREGKSACNPQQLLRCWPWRVRAWVRAPHLPAHQPLFVFRWRDPRCSTLFHPSFLHICLGQVPRRERLRRLPHRPRRRLQRLHRGGGCAAGWVRCGVGIGGRGLAGGVAALLHGAAVGWGELTRKLRFSCVAVMPLPTAANRRRSAPRSTLT